MYDKFKEQAEEIAEDKGTDELAKLGFIYAYIANHMTTLLAEQIKRQDKLLWSILVVLAVGMVANALFS